MTARIKGKWVIIDYSEIENTPELSAYDAHINTSAIHFEKTDISASDIQYSSTELSANNVRDGLDELKKNIEDLDASSWEVDGVGYIKPKDDNLVKVENIEGAVHTSAYDAHIETSAIHFEKTDIDYSDIQNTPETSAYDAHIETSAIHFEKTDIDYSDIQNTPETSAYDAHIETSAIHFEKTDISYNDLQDIPITSFTTTFNSVDWLDTVDLKYLDFIHSLNTINPVVELYEGSFRVFPQSIEVLDSNTIRINITDTEEFTGTIRILK